MPALQRISILGAGAWGTALANVCARQGRAVAIYDSDPNVLAEIAGARTNATRLPGIAIEQGVETADDLAATAAADALLLVVPTQQLRTVCGDLAARLAPGTPIVACAKGIERGTGKFVTEIVEELIPSARPAVLSGPSFAADVARGLPTAVTLAATDGTLAMQVAEALKSPTFRVYHTTDVRGVEIGGAAKNVIAIAAGIAVGRKLGASAQAALTTRGFGELLRFGRAYGAKPETLTGLSGLGDLILTATSPQSRNYSLGVALGSGKSVAEASGGRLTEGAFTASALVDMARKAGVEMPIAEAVNDVLAGRLEVGEAIARLLSRPMGAEV